MSPKIETVEAPRGTQRADPSTPSARQVLGLARRFAEAQVRSGTAAVHGEPGLL